MKKSKTTVLDYDLALGIIQEKIFSISERVKSGDITVSQFSIGAEVLYSLIEDFKKVQL